ncbi:MAG: ribonuclease [Clostridiales bacterium]|jgi:ribonuclease-3|nr:ribonuclease III [Eubacteriales bacterium]MDD3197320.1 ribonuclease III [Eubacteriales bacterium]MDD3503763.1 ribonuclease III [Eubacteriales bacterium]MDD4681651.1 ribonuclease III [Eubacteriales bacterium]MDN5314298.1 ribonuclease [Clostridiales bacterium]
MIYNAIDPDRTNQLNSFCRGVDYKFSDIKLLNEALTHSTYAYEHRNQGLTDNERLEFLGDAVLDLVISEILFRNTEGFAEGYMTKTRALVVCENTLADVARVIRLGDYLMLGRGEEATGGRDKPSNLSNAMEALFGAVFIDGGFEQASRIITRLLGEPLEQALKGKMVYDYKSKLLELVQSTRGNSTMRFEIINEEGPVHDRTFTAAVIVDENEIAQGQGSSKKEAEQQAARAALQNLDCTRSGCQQVDNSEDGKV